MCGIVGIRDFARPAVDAGLLEEMTARLKHRGPDDSGTWVGRAGGGSVGLGHTRLSIIDLAGSTQPMSTPDGRYVLVFNGEILNYAELRRSLDYPFHTDGDTEVLLAGLLQHGPAFVTRLAGQFAFALVDTHEGDVLLARDRLGILPLFYHLQGGTLLFASEVKALLPALPGIEVDLESLDSYLAHNAVHAPFTLFDGVRKVLPGHVLQDRQHGRAHPRPVLGPSCPGRDTLARRGRSQCCPPCHPGGGALRPRGRCPRRGLPERRA